MAFHTPGCGRQIGSPVGCRCRSKPETFPVRVGRDWVDPVTGEVLTGRPAPAVEPVQLELPDRPSLRDLVRQLVSEREPAGEPAGRTGDAGPGR